MMSLSLKPS